MGRTDDICKGIPLAGAVGRELDRGLITQGLMALQAGSSQVDERRAAEQPLPKSAGTANNYSTMAHTGANGVTTPSSSTVEKSGLLDA